MSYMHACLYIDSSLPQQVGIYLGKTVHQYSFALHCLCQTQNSGISALVLSVNRHIVDICSFFFNVLVLDYLSAPMNTI